MISYVNINRLNNEFEVRYFSVELEKEFKVYPAPQAIGEKIESLLIELEAIPQEEARLLLLEKEVAEIQVEKEELLVAKQEVETRSEKFKEYLLAKDLTEEEMLDLIDIFPSWEVGVAYVANDRVKFENRLFRVIQNHTSQADWSPIAASSLFTEIAPPSVIAEWKQPTGGHDAYQRGDKVLFQGVVYESTIDSNSWSPLTYPQGWQVSK